MSSFHLLTQLLTNLDGVLTKRRRWQSEGYRVTAKAQRATGQLDRSQCGVLRRPDQILLANLRTGVHRVKGLHLTGGNAGRVKASEPLFDPDCGEGRPDHLDEFSPVRDPPVVGGETDIVRVEAHQGREPTPNSVVPHSDHDGTVAGVEDPVRADRGMLVSRRDTEFTGKKNSGALKAGKGDLTCP